MPHQPSENWAETYINDGYLLVPDLVIPQECDEIKSEMLKIFRGDYECTAIPPMSENVTETEVLYQINLIRRLLIKSSIARHGDLAMLTGIRKLLIPLIWY